MSVRHLRLTTAAAAVALGTAALLGSGAATAANAAPKPKPAKGNPNLVDVQLLSINDFHGNLEPPGGSSGLVSELQPDGSVKPVTVGGVQYLADRLNDARATNPNTLTVAAGDLIGASPLLSGAFHDEPTVEAMNLLGLDVTSVGNHEFDEGSAELLRMQNGGCRTNPDGTKAADSCARPEPFAGASYDYLSANVVYTDTGKPLFKPYVVKEVGGVKVGFIGMTLKGTPDIVTAAGVQGLSFLDEVSTANKYANELQEQGVKSIVVLLHQGGLPAKAQYNYDCNAGGALGLTGDIIPIAQQISPKVDLLVTGHTHNAYVCNIPDPDGNPRLVTSASSFGRLFTKIGMTINTKSGDVVRPSVTAANQPVLRIGTGNAAENALIAEYKTLIAPIANRVVGRIGGTIAGRGCTGACAPTGETPAGDLIADAQLAGMKNDPLNPGGADFAIMNPGGIRGDFTCVPATSPCDVTYEAAFTVQPFTNIMNVVAMSGADVITMFGQ